MIPDANMETGPNLVTRGKLMATGEQGPWYEGHRALA